MNRDRSRVLKREREAHLRKVDRDKLRAMRLEVARLRGDIARHRVESQRRRRELLRRMREQFRGVRRLDRERRRKMLSDLVEAQREFRVWWAAVRAERRARLERLRQGRVHLRAWRSQTKDRIRAALEALEREQVASLRAYDESAAHRAVLLADALERAQQDMYDERRDQRQFRRTARHVSKKKTSKRERSEEFTSGVEANLLTAEEHAVWHAARKQILADARRRGITAPDAIAELVRERTELDPDLALEHLQSAADRFLEAELRKKGWM